MMSSLTAQCLDTLGMINSPTGFIFGLFVAGLVSGFTHCAGMCGPFVLAQVNTQGDLGLSRLSGGVLLPYHLGRMTTYVGLSTIFHSVLNLAFVFTPYKALIAVPLLLTAATVFIVSAFPSLSRLFPWAARIAAGLPVNVVMKAFQRFNTRTGFAARYGMGIILGMMPCGMVVAAIMATALAPTGLHAALAMAAFAVGTMPALMMIGLGGQTLRWRYPIAFARLQRGMMVFSSLWLLAAAGWLIFGSI
ncbi:MAG: sulfite exporter TauE/SafE family protein [Alphaproteobacteria bacterium]|nr:sulfite exporter TauE/SafE family protein [Alphaproteobacteria bacterium]